MSEMNEAQRRRFPRAVVVELAGMLFDAYTAERVRTTPGVTCVTWGVMMSDRPVAAGAWLEVARTAIALLEHGMSMPGDPPEEPPE